MKQQYKVYDGMFFSEPKLHQSDIRSVIRLYDNELISVGDELMLSSGVGKIIKMIPFENGNLQLHCFLTKKHKYHMGGNYTTVLLQNARVVKSNIYSDRKKSHFSDEQLEEINKMIDEKLKELQ